MHCNSTTDIKRIVIMAGQIFIITHFIVSSCCSTLISNMHILPRLKKIPRVWYCRCRNQLQQHHSDYFHFDPTDTFILVSCSFPPHTVNWMLGTCHYLSNFLVRYREEKLELPLWCALCFIFTQTAGASGLTRLHVGRLCSVGFMSSAAFCRAAVVWCLGEEDH